MADNLRKYTTQEVLNKVYTDSSGITIGLNSQSSKETLNAVLDSSNNRLQVAIAGGTISGDVTISGDLTVTGSNTYSYTEALSGTGTAKANFDIMTLTNTVNAADMDGTETSILFNQYYYDGTTPAVADSGRISIGTETDWTSTASTQDSYMAFETALDGTVAEKMRITSAGRVGIGTTSPDSDNILHIKNTSGDNRGIIIENTVATSYAEIHLKANKEYRIGTGGSSTLPTNRFYIYDAGANAHRFDIDTNGNVGIGTTAPGDYNAVANKLVVADGGNSGITIASGTTSYGALYFADGTSGTAEYMGGVEYNHNGNVMRIFVNGAVSIELDSTSRISLSNNTSFDSGTSNTVFGKNIGVHSGIDAGSNYNVFIGEDVASDNALADATNNVVIGYQAGEDLASADNCVFIGYQAGSQHSQSSGSTAIGYRAMYNSSGLDNWGNTFIGFGAAAGNWTTAASNGNVGVGYQVLHGALNDADYNVAVGYQAGYSMTEGTQNTLLGYKAGVALTSGVKNTAIGGSALLSGVSNSQNVAVGYQALTNTTSDSNVAVGEQSGLSNTSGTFNTAVGRSSFYYNQTGSNNTAIGYNAQLGVSGNSHSNNTSVGYRSMVGITTGTQNTALGRTSLPALTTGGNNIGIGFDSGLLTTEGNHNVFIGTESGAANTTGDELILIGYRAGYAINHASDADGTVAVGYQALTALTSGNSNTALGNRAGAANTTGYYNTYLGYDAGLLSDVGLFNTAIGAHTYNDAVGDMRSNTVVGAVAGGFANASSDNNTVLGAWALRNGTGAIDNNVVIGNEACDGLGDNNPAMSKNVFIGSFSGSGTWGTNAVSYNTAVGYGTMGNQLDGSLYNVALGYAVLGSLTTGDSNIALGSFALYDLVDGSNNIAIGHSSGENLTSSNCVLIGHQAGNLLTTGTDNVIIGYDADVDANDRDGCIVIGKGLSLNTASDNVVEIGNNTNSMTYDLDGGDITVTSDVRTKKDIKDTKLGLEFINKLRPITYKTKPSSEYPKEFGVKEPSKKSSGKTWDGLIAQEVKETMDEMNVEFSGWEEGINTKQRLAYGKFVMPLIKAVQELSAEVKQLKKQLEDK